MTDALITSLIQQKESQGISLVLDVKSDEVSDAVLFKACVYLIKDDAYYYYVEKFLNRLRNAFPIETASVEAYLALKNASIDNVHEIYTRVLSLLKNALEQNQENALIHCNIAYVYAKLHDKKNALKWARQSLLLKNPPVQALLLLIRILRSNCQMEEALKLAISGKALIGHNDRDVLIEGLFVASELGRQEATMFFNTLKEEFGADPIAKQALVLVNLMCEDKENADNCLKAWAQSDEVSPGFLFCCSRMFVDAEYDEGALSALMDACELEPTNGLYQAALASVLFKMDHKDRALHTARTAVRYDPENLHARLALANISMDKEEVAKELEKAVELRAGYVDLSGMEILLPSLE